MLISEDDETLAETLTEVFRGEGYDTARVQTLDEVRNELAARRCVLLLDSGLAENQSAVEWLASLAARDEGPPTIIVSGSKDAEALGLRYRVHFVEKPFDLDRLLTLVGQVASQRNSRPSLT